MKQACGLMWLRWRSSSSSSSSSSSRFRRRSSPAFETLTHSASPSRTFHHKSRPVPLSALEKFRASTTTAADPSKPRPLAFFVLHITGPASTAAATTTTRRSGHGIGYGHGYGYGFRSYSQSSYSSSLHTHTMAEQVHWTGPKVRETFLNYFAEKRGHTIGMHLAASFAPPFLPFGERASLCAALGFAPRVIRSQVCLYFMLHEMALSSLT